MDIQDIALLRTQTQQISVQYFNDAEKVLGYMGALQSQDFAMSKWAIGLRCNNATETSVEKAISESQIIRTHLMRPTWHTVAASDLRWLLDLTAPRIKPLLKSHHLALGLKEDLLERSKTIIQTALKNQSLNREELSQFLEADGVPTGGQRASMIMFYLELEGIICSGEVKSKQHTYALVEKSAPLKNSLQPHDQLAELAWRYFNSHGPATIEDFTWWSGLQKTKARKALELISDKLTNVVVGGSIYWYSKNLDTTIPADDRIYLLPAYDEFIISYKDRSAVISSAHTAQAINKNGIFWPVIVYIGQVIGTWSRVVKKDKVVVKPVPFIKFTIKQKKLIEKAAADFGAFLDLKAEVVL